MLSPKVFVVGFHKTATSSMATALYILDYTLEGHDVGELDKSALIGLSNDETHSTIWEHMQGVLTRCDAVQDIPWSVFYKELDETYPGSKFILTTRPTDAWIKSVCDHFGTMSGPIGQWIYGVPCPVGYEDVYRARYEKHNADVQEYFKERPDDLLVLGLGEQLNWDNLCGFLGHDVPSFSFPSTNQAKRASRTLPARLSRAARRKFQAITNQTSDFDAAYGLYGPTQEHIWSFTNSVTSALELNPTAQVLDDVTSTLRTVTERVTDLKSFLALDGPPDRVEAITSLESFDRTWAPLARHLRHVAGSVSYQNVHDDVPGTGRSIQQSLEEIQALLRKGEPASGAVAQTG